MLAVTLLALVAASPSSPCTRLTVTGTLDPRSHDVTGTASCTLGRDANLRIATYPRLLRSAEGIDDVRHTWFYPQGFEPAEMTLTDAATGETLEGSGAWQSLGQRRAGDVVTVRFVSHVPRRNGVYGERDGVFYMLGGWHPAFADEGAPVVATEVEYHLTAPRSTVGFAGVTPLGARGPRRLDGVMTARFVPWLVAGAARVTRYDAAVIVHPRSAPHGDLPYDLRDLSQGLDGVAEHELADTLATGSSWAEARGIAHERLIVVLAPLRERLIERFDGGIAISDRAFHVAKLMQQLQRLALWRAQLASYLVPKARAVETGAEALPVGLAADTLAVILRDALAHGLYPATEYAPQLFEHIAVIPEIDSLIWAPQVAFADAYYEAIDETPKARNHLDDFDTDLPRGKLLAVKLVDRVGETGALVLAESYLAGSSPWLSVVRAGTDDEVVAGLREWIGPTPKIDYAIGEVRTTETETTVRVDERGPDADRVHEPITVRLRYGDHVVEGSRIGPGDLVFPGFGHKPSLVYIDPHERTVQLAMQPGETTRYNDRSSPRWRFLLNDIGGLFQVTNQAVSVNADFAIRRLNDLRYAYGFSAAYAPESVGVSAGATYKFGHLITPLLFSDHIGVAVGYNRLRGSFDNATPGDLLSLSVGYGRDTRMNPYFAFEGEGFQLGGGVGVGRDDHGKDYVFGQLGAGVLRLWKIALGHALVGRLRGDILLGGVPIQSELRLGGRYRGGRGYETNEARGLRRMVASAEYRHILQADMRSDWFRLFMLTRIEGAFFGDVVALPVDRVGCHQTVFTDVGYSIRFLGDVLNLYTSALGFDFGFPLNRCEDQRYRLPFTVYASFLQSFAAF